MWLISKQTTEDAAAATAAAKDETAEAQPTTNGVSEEIKTNGDASEETKEAAATESETAAPAAEVKEAAEVAVKEAIVSATKTIDEKHTAEKPEVNDVQHIQDTQNSTITTTDTNTVIPPPRVDAPSALDEPAVSAETPIPINTDNLNEQAIDTVTNSQSICECTNNTNIDNIDSDPSAPPLPDCPPPSHISEKFNQFAETAMSTIDTVHIEHPQTIPIIDTQPIVPNEHSALVGDIEHEQEQEQNENASEPENVESVADESASADKDADATAEVEVIEQEQEEPVTNVESIVEEPVVEHASATDDTKSADPIKDDVSVDISSPLPQNSLESLTSTNVSPPSENDETPIEHEDVSSLPPPPPSPPVDEAPIDQSIESIGANGTAETDEAHANGTQNGNGKHAEENDDEDDDVDQLPPPPASEPADQNDIIDALKANGIAADHAANGDNHVHDSVNDSAVDDANNVSDKVITTIYDTHVLSTHWLKIPSYYSKNKNPLSHSHMPNKKKKKEKNIERLSISLYS